MKIFNHPGILLLICFTLVMSSLITYTAFLNGKENWNNHISEIERKNLSTDSEILCIMYKYGFKDIGLFDDPTILDFITSGYSNVPNYCKSCIDIQQYFHY